MLTAIGNKNSRCLHRGAAVQRGAALMSMLLVTALLSILAAQLIDLSGTTISKASRSAQVQQTYWFARAGERFAMSVLAEDALQTDPALNVDSLHDIWAQPFEPFRPDGARLDVVIKDLNGCFNVNSLGSSNDSTPLRILQSLLSVLNVPVAKLQQLQTHVASRPLFNLQEFGDLLSLGTTALAELGESVCVLPSRENRININTADKKLLEVFVGQAAAENIIDMRKKQAIPSLAAADLSNNFDSSTTLEVSSDYFSVLSTAQYEGRTRAIYTRLFRQETGVLRVVDRQDIAPSLALLSQQLGNQARLLR